MGKSYCRCEAAHGPWLKSKNSDSEAVRREREEDSRTPYEHREKAMTRLRRSLA
jgi:hypothetical protein